MKPQNELNLPWSLHFDREGTEDVAIIVDAKGHDLVRSRHFWLPEERDSVPATLAGMWLMHAAPKLAAALQDSLDAIRDLPIAMLDGPAYAAFTAARAALTEAATGNASAQLLKSIVIHMSGRRVTTVSNLPPGYRYEVKDYDNLPEPSDVVRELSDPTNAKRARWARHALALFAIETFGCDHHDLMDSEDCQSAIGDLICGLLHLAHGKGFDSLAILEQAKAHFETELTSDQ